MRSDTKSTLEGTDQGRKSVRDSVFERNKKTWVVVITLFVVSFVDAGLGILYRVVNGYPWAERPQRIAQSRERDFRQSSSIFHHGLRENRSLKDVRWGSRVYEVTTDSLGFKNGSMKTVSLASDKYRLLFMGDSFTEGIGVEYASTFVGIIESKLATMQIEVLNAAASSYSPIIYWRKIKHLLEDVGLRFDEVIVYIDVTDAFDEAKLYRLGEYGNVIDRAPLRMPPQDAASSTSSVKNIARDNTILFYSIYTVSRHAVLALLGGGPTAEEEYLTSEPNLWTVDQKVFEDWGKEGLEYMTLYMDKLLALLRGHDIRLTVAVYPHPQQIIHNDLNSIQVTHWKSWCQKNRVGFINHFPSFLETDERAKETIQRYFIKGDVHWNEAGHRLVAETFLAHRSEQQTQETWSSVRRRNASRKPSMSH